MKNKPNTNTHEANQTQTPLKAKSIKLGIDLHADFTNLRTRTNERLCHRTPQAAGRARDDPPSAGQRLHQPSLTARL